jgi:hypothetical protein
LNDRKFRQVNVIFWRLHRAKMLEGAFSVQLVGQLGRFRRQKFVHGHFPN